MQPVLSKLTTRPSDHFAKITKILAEINHNVISLIQCYTALNKKCNVFICVAMVILLREKMLSHMLSSHFFRF